jgi:hypothetical protein
VTEVTPSFSGLVVFVTAKSMYVWQRVNEGWNPWPGFWRLPPVMLPLKPSWALFNARQVHAGAVSKGGCHFQNYLAYFRQDYLA